MAQTITKVEFRTPNDILHDEIHRLKLAPDFKPEAVTAGPLLGTWVNCDHHTRSLVRLMINASATGITVHGFGACSPTPCDWGTTSGMIYASNVTSSPALAFTATYNFGFKQTILVGHLLDGALMVESFDHFTDNSGRSDYYSQNILSQ